MMLDFPEERTIREVLEVVPVESYPADRFVVAVEMEENICIDKLGIYARDLIRCIDTGTSGEIPQLALADETGVRILEGNS